MKHPHTLSATARVEVRFNECDPLGIVWHGNYVKYLEEGREAFGKKYSLDYMDMYMKGYATPIVHLQTDYKRSLQYRDVALIETMMRKTEAAKIIFDYVIRREIDNELICKASTTQVFVRNGTMDLALVVPDFFMDWRKLNGI